MEMSSWKIGQKKNHFSQIHQISIHQIHDLQIQNIQIHNLQINEFTIHKVLGFHSHENQSAMMG